MESKCTDKGKHFFNCRCLENVLCSAESDQETPRCFSNRKPYIWIQSISDVRIVTINLGQ